MVQFTSLRFKVDGKDVNAPIEWPDVNVKATFDNESLQANIETSEFTFVLEGRDEIYNWINNGLNGGPGIFEGPTLQIDAYKGTDVYNIFKGYLNLSDELQYNRFPVGSKKPVEIASKIVKSNGLNQLDSLLESVNVSLLEAEGVFSGSDYQNVKFAVEKKINFVEVAIVLVTIYLMAKEIAESIARLQELVVEIATIIGGGGITGGIGAAILAAGKAVIIAAYTAFMIIQITNLFLDLINQLVPIIRKHKCIQLRTFLTKIASRFGLGFESSIPELDTYYYLPSAPTPESPSLNPFKVNTIKVALPKPNDYGYNCKEAFNLCLEMFNAKLAVVDNKIQMHWRDSEYWIKTSTFKLPDVKLERKQFNTNEIKSSILLEFSIDQRDEWTIDNYLGTTYLASTLPKTIQNIQNVTIRNFDRVTFPVALGNRKDRLNPVEQALKAAAEVFDAILSAFGKNSNLAKKIENRKGVLKLSSEIHSMPKILNLNGDKINASHRENLSAKHLYNNYHIEKSFIHDNYKRQRAVYNNVTIPFTMDSFNSLIENSYFTTQEGKVGKVTSIDWNIDSDTADVSFWIQEVYTKNLKEVFNEQA